jgi:hypothetical protein
MNKNLAVSLIAVLATIYSCSTTRHYPASETTDNKTKESSLFSSGDSIKQINMMPRKDTIPANVVFESTDTTAEYKKRIYDNVIECDSKQLEEIMSQGKSSKIRFSEIGWRPNAVTGDTMYYLSNHPRGCIVVDPSDSVKYENPVLEAILFPKYIASDTIRPFNYYPGDTTLRENHE